MQKKRYHTFNEHLRYRFGEKVFKVSLDAGFTCPNRDGRLGWSGCVYCSERGSGDFAGDQRLSLHDQFNQVAERMKKKWPSAKYLAYFQAYTNTYASVHRLREVYEKALTEENVIGLSISTRPDCLPEDVLDYLEELNQRTYLWVELGLQSKHDRTMDWIKRGHNYSQFLEGLDQLRSRGIRVCAHIILGLPGESKAEMLETAQAVASLPIQGIKLHLLHVLRGTPLAKMYEQKPFELMTKEDYVSLVVDILEILPPEMVIHRLTGDGPPEDLIGPLWSRKKWEVLNAIDAELERRDTWQGKWAKK
ncbi:TIGR01212 family radical SAM protein [Desulfosporosinus sp.]|uniref:TIGR01212 family radical SAM protein n=1 Tax=Desulfosporosinus sp. TaxID=157907 RepID=UPI000E9E9605|nr:TIGR01212 family radical SAM protein [Desulfosporosinus sp.]MBC2722171.1 TIGR01212 family radical SAM protein [Desulfosporosinus sp.]MBC2728416.1 TIGR01212 family radical SAM protein [Desulfosporosinus sp.]HBV85130.1 TIGR01212 family radical SAM protein [Desulfosporosinus sp.]